MKNKHKTILKIYIKNIRTKYWKKYEKIKETLECYYIFGIYTKINLGYLTQGNLEIQLLRSPKKALKN